MSNEKTKSNNPFRDLVDAESQNSRGLSSSNADAGPSSQSAIASTSEELPPITADPPPYEPGDQGNTQFGDSKGDPSTQLSYPSSSAYASSSSSPPPSQSDSEFRDIKVASWRDEPPPPPMNTQHHPFPQPSGPSSLPSGPYAASSRPTLPPALPQSYPVQSSGPVQAPSQSPMPALPDLRALNPLSQLLSPSSSNTPREPLPSSFSRPPPSNLPYSSFTPIFLVSNGKHLDKGFPAVPPPADAGQPHPFSTHDINQEDWLRFLEDIKKAGTLTDKQKMNAEHIPLVSDLPIVNIIAAHAMKKHMKGKKKGPVSELINTWNHHFFNPRRLEVVLMRGQERLSGLNNVPIGNLHIPHTVNLSGLSASNLPSSQGSSNDRLEHDFTPGNASDDGKLKKGKEKEGKDKTFRLFVVPLGS